jgi:hypothetical protein
MQACEVPCEVHVCETYALSIPSFLSINVLVNLAAVNQMDPYDSNTHP